MLYIRLADILIVEHRAQLLKPRYITTTAAYFNKSRKLIKGHSELIATASFDIKFVHMSSHCQAAVMAVCWHATMINPAEKDKFVTIPTSRLQFRLVTWSNRRLVFPFRLTSQNRANSAKCSSDPVCYLKQLTDYRCATQ